MSDIEWKENNLPVSMRFDDPYYSNQDGRAETDYVFIKGNALPLRWTSTAPFTIAELGFGTGLNFLETVHQYQSSSYEPAALRYIAFEQYPIQTDEIDQALSIWPELKTYRIRLIDAWNSLKSGRSYDFMPKIELVIHFGDANTLLPNASFLADAWYLDGFSPAKNPELWNENLMAEVAKHTVAGGTFATYTSAGFVRRGLQSAGFSVKKVKGFGKKREMLCGIKGGDIHVADRH
ncbi:MAG: tRNA (5-methylaminomethyl-2-thiouridine)(34)-methyltransferase MnmD [Pseudomonadota bacterium]